MNRISSSDVGEASRGLAAGCTSRRVILCRCDYAHVVSAESCERIRAALEGAFDRVLVVPDLCGCAAARDPAMLEAAAESGTAIVACRRRSVHALLRGAGFPEGAPLPEVFDLTTQAPAAVLKALGVDMPCAASLPAGPAAPEPEWQPWFPAIDYDRCTTCRQCMSFCPFGVYTLAPDSKRVLVTNPRNCKNNCPACARICPEFAIIFPKVKDAPIDGSEILPEHSVRRAVAALDPNSDIHALLARRRQRAGLGRFERNLGARDAAISAGNPAVEQAEQERATCVRKAAASP